MGAGGSVCVSVCVSERDRKGQRAEGGDKEMESKGERERGGGRSDQIYSVLHYAFSKLLLYHFGKNLLICNSNDHSL